MTELVFASIGAAAAICILLVTAYALYRHLRYSDPIARWNNWAVFVLALIAAATPPYGAWGTGGMALLAAFEAFLLYVDTDQRPPKGFA